MYADENGNVLIQGAGGAGILDLVAGDNIEITRNADGKFVISAVDTAVDIAAGQNITIDIDPETGTAIINSLIGGPTNEHYKGVFDTPEDLIAFDTNPEQGDYGMIKQLVFSDGGDVTWNGQYKYCFYINGVWTVVDQMLTFTDDVELLQQFYSVGGSSPVIYLHDIAMTGSFNSLRDVPIVATPVVTVDGSTITATCETEGAEIWYTDDGSMPHVNGTKYTGPFQKSIDKTYRFVGIKNGMINSQEAVISTNSHMAAPIIDLDWHDGTVSMTNPNPGGTIYYTTDGSEPTDQSTPYSDPFVITEATTFKLVVVDEGIPSPVTVQRYEQANKINTFWINRNFVRGVFGFTFTAPSSGEAHYEMFDAMPTFDSPVSQGNISFPIYDLSDNPRWYSVRVFAPGCVPSVVATSPQNGYSKPTAPAISYDADSGLVSIVQQGETSSIQLVPRVISSGCAIRYTLDGSIPTENSLVYSEPFAITENMTVKAVLIAYGQYYSDVSEQEIVIMQPPAITLDSNSGDVFISGPDGSSLYYTTDGSDPTTESQQYSAPFSVINISSVTVKAIAVKDGHTSGISEETFRSLVWKGSPYSNMDYLSGLYYRGPRREEDVASVFYGTSASEHLHPSTWNTYSQPVAMCIFDESPEYLFFKQTKPGFIPSVYSGTWIPSEQPDAPVIDADDNFTEFSLSLSGNTYEIPLQTNTNLPTLGARIYYTVDGSDPSAQNGILYTGGVVSIPSGSIVVKAVTVCYGEFESMVSSSGILISVKGVKSVLEVSAPAGIDIYYTRGDTAGGTPNPDKNSTKYTGPVPLLATLQHPGNHFKFIYYRGDVAGEIIAKEFQLANGGIRSVGDNDPNTYRGISIITTSGDAGYTTMYSYQLEPSIVDAVPYEGRIEIPYLKWKPENIILYSGKDGMITFEFDAEFNHGLTPDAPGVNYNDSTMQATFSMVGNAYGISIGNHEVVAQNTALIYYTLDGSTPSPQNGTLYTKTAIQLSKGQVLKAMYVLYDQFDSNIATQNVYVPESVLSEDEVAIVVKNNTTGELRYAPYTDVDASAIENGGYTLKPFIQFTRGKDGKPVFMHKDQTSGMWAEFNRYRLACDTSAPGGFDWSVVINGTTKSGNVTWQAGDTLDDILAQLNTQAVATYLVFSHVSGENFIRIQKGGYSNSTFTLSNNTGATLTDLSLYTKIGDVQQAETHRDWQSMNVNEMFPTLGFLAANTVQYAVNGFNLSYMCGGNETKYKAYYRTNGSSTYLAENAVSSRMSEAAFNALDGSGVAEQQELYDKYDGSWDAYMEASMVKIDDTNSNGIEYQSYDNGDTQTAALVSVTTMDFDGSYIPAFPCAANCQNITDNDVANGKFNMNTEHELAVFMRDAKMSDINAAFDVLIAAGMTATKLSVSSYHYWSVARCHSYIAWLYNANTGRLHSNGLSLGFAARPLAYPVNS